MAGTFDINEKPAKMLKMVFDYAAKRFPGTIADLSNALAAQALEIWQAEAENAGPWGSKYASTLQMKPMTGDSGTAEVFADLEHENIKFLHMMEDGVKSWSIKDALMESDRVKRNKKGLKYIIVPFRHRTPGKTKKTSSFASVMPKDIYDAAISGEKLGSDSGKYAGLARYGGKGHGEFMTFRIVTEKSKGWQYPARAPTPVYAKVQETVNKLVVDTIMAWATAELKKMQGEFE